MDKNFLKSFLSTGYPLGDFGEKIELGKDNQGNLRVKFSGSVVDKLGISGANDCWIGNCEMGKNCSVWEKIARTSDNVVVDKLVKSLLDRELAQNGVNFGIWENGLNV